MSEKPDHIEDSLRKAFEGFELPVSDADWNAIAQGLEKTPVKKGGWLFFGNKFFILSFLLLITAGFGFFWLNQPSGQKAENTAPAEVSQSPKQAAKPETGVNAGNPDHAATSNPETQTNMEGSQAKEGATVQAHSSKTGETNTPQAGTVGNTSKTEPPVNDKPAVENPVVANPENPVLPAVTSPEPTTPVIGTVGGILEQMIQMSDLVANSMHSIRFTELDLSPGGKTRLPMAFAIKPMPKTGLEWYSSLQTSFDPSKATARPGAPEWGGVQMNSYRQNQLNIRFEAGATKNIGSFNLGTGFAFETSAYDKGGDDTILVKIPVKVLPYITLQKDTLWLVQKTRDSFIILHHAPKRQWIEIPVYLSKKFSIGKNMNLVLGASLNPGYMTGSNGGFINPYAFGALGYYSPYLFGRDKQTLNSTGNSTDFSNRFRFGSGLQAGIEKTYGNFSYGMQLQTRYYYTPVWKDEVPLKQHTFNYGLNFRIGVKF